jgi:hypothetical protein
VPAVLVVCVGEHLFLKKTKNSKKKKFWI